MRSRITIATVVLGCLAIGTLFVMRQQSKAPEKTAAASAVDLPAAQTPQANNSTAPVLPAPETPINKAPIVSSSAASSSQPVGAALLSASGTNATAAAKAAHEAHVAERVSTLLDLAMDNSKASLDTILSELTNSDSQIRRGALEATIQYSSRDAIPRLAEVAGQTDDPQEKAALNDAIEFLKLPSLTEIVEANKGLAPPRIVKAARPGVPTTRPPAAIQQ